MFPKRIFKPSKISSAKKQSGSMIIMALFVIIVIGLLAGALINVVSASSDSTIHQVYGLRAKQAAKAGIDDLLAISFPINGAAVSCNTTVVSPSSFSNVRGLNGCSYSGSCTTQVISFNGVDRMHFNFSSAGSCEIGNNVVSRKLSVDAIEEMIP